MKRMLNFNSEVSMAKDRVKVCPKCGSGTNVIFATDKCPACGASYDKKAPKKAAKKK